VFIGSCTNSSYRDLMTVAAILRGRRVHPGVSLTISPGSRQVLAMIAANGALADLVGAGARILESTCGPCIGMGQAPPTGAVSLRTFNRNFKGRSGTKDALVYLVSPETAAASAVAGTIADPRALGEAPKVKAPRAFLVDDGMILPPAADPAAVEVVRGPNIKPLPEGQPLVETIEGEVLLKVGDDITTDHIMPAGAKVLPLRSNIPAIAEHVFAAVDPEFAARARTRCRRRAQLGLQPQPRRFAIPGCAVIEVVRASTANREPASPPCPRETTTASRWGEPCLGWPASTWAKAALVLGGRAVALKHLPARATWAYAGRRRPWRS
jgi:aconitase A